MYLLSLLSFICCNREQHIGGLEMCDFVTVFVVSPGPNQLNN